MSKRASSKKTRRTAQTSAKRRTSKRGITTQKKSKSSTRVEVDLDSIIQKTRLSKTQRLVLINRGLTELPESIGTLKNLRSLNLSQNKLSSLPASIGQLKRLKTLSLMSNRLHELPDSMGDLTELEELHLLENPILIQESILKLPKLRHLCTSHPQTNNLFNAVGVESLMLPDSGLTFLPEAIGQMTNLIELDLSSNALSELPDSIGNLAKLKVLDLTNNRLRTLPNTLRNLRALTELYLHRNPALELPAELLGSERHSGDGKRANPSEILEYYFRVQGGRRPLNEAKLILVGRGGVGKTSLVNRMVHGIFKPEKKTEGIKITEWKLQLNGKEDVRLNIWDFGGQEIMHATHQFFLTQRSLYLLVLNGREGGEDLDAEYWLKLIESFGGESPVIVVLNKIKEHAFDLNRRALQQKYPAVRDVIKTDCQDETGLRQLRKAIERETDRLEHLRDPFPASWFSIKDRLASMRKNYLSFDEYRAQCAKMGEKDQDAQDSLAFYLHSLGIALNYKDDLRLQDTHVLNPRWVTNGIYKILNSARLEKQRGEIWLDDLKGILDTKKYPAKMHLFLFDLMKKFELCFSFPDDDRHYLIPELLDKQEPPETNEFKASRCLNFQYHYPVLPEGLLPRFIVRTHILSEGQPRWRTGVILHFEGCRALIKGDVQDKRVFISVSGPAAAQRRLLAVIRSDFERIHRDIRNLQPQQMVPVPKYPYIVISYDDLLLWESQNRTHYSVRADKIILDLSVGELLNGIELAPNLRKEASKMEEIRRPIRLFYSYSHADEDLRNELETHLKLLQRQGIVSTWHDRKIDAGDDWKRRIDENIDRADIILLLVSSSFIASDYCYEREMKRALERYDEGFATVIPIIIRDVNWRIAPFAKLQALPKDGKAVTRWRNKDSAWRNISEGIERVVNTKRLRSGVSLSRK